MECPLVIFPNIAKVDVIWNRNNSLTSHVPIVLAKWILTLGELAAEGFVIVSKRLKLVKVCVLRTSVYGEGGGCWDVIDEPGVDTRPVHLRVGGGGVNDVLNLRHCTPQCPELIRNNLSSFFSSFPSSSFLRLDFIEFKVRCNAAYDAGDRCEEGIFL